MGDPIADLVEPPNFFDESVEDRRLFFEFVGKRSSIADVFQDVGEDLVAFDDRFLGRYSPGFLHFFPIGLLDVFAEAPSFPVKEKEPYRRIQEEGDDEEDDEYQRNGVYGL